MSPSATFWMDALISFGISLAALSLLVLVMGTGPRQRLNQTFALCAASAALVGLGATFADVTYWLNTQELLGSEGLGTPLFWMELAAVGFYFLGPSLLVFSIAYVEAVTTGDELNRSVGQEKTRAYKLVVAIGFLAGAVLLPVILHDRVIAQLFLDEVGVLHVEFTKLGYVASVAPLLLECLALTLFWRNRQRPGGAALTVATAAWLVGSIAVVLVSISYPIDALTMGINVLVAGYVVLNFQVFRPLRTLTVRLEATVAERTRELRQARDRLQRFNEQQLRVAQISRDISQITDSSEMLAQLVELIHNRLGYHHIYVFQPDATSQYLVIRTAAGTTARMVMESGFRLRIGGNSLAGRAAAEHRPMIAQDQGDHSTYFDDTALPGARAEIAVPLLVGERLLGVVDLQSIHLEAFTDEDMVLITTLSDQVAVALDNCRLLRETEAALTEVGQIQRQYVRDVWRSAASPSGHSLAYVYTDTEGITRTDLQAAWSPEISQAAAGDQALSDDGEDGQGTGSARVQLPDLTEGEPAEALALPVKLRGQVIGALRLRHRSGRTWRPEEIDAVNEVTERLALALETARLSEEAQRLAAHDRLIGEISARLRETLDVETVLRTAAQEMRRSLNLPEVTIRLGAPPDDGDGQDVSPSDRFDDQE